MAVAVEKIYKDALKLSNDSKEALIEKLIINIEKNISPDIEKAHLQEVTKRRNDIRKKNVTPISGDKGLKSVREILKK